MVSSFVYYSDLGFLARGFLTATAGSVTGAVVTTGAGSGAISVARRNGQSVVGASILYGATGGVSGGVGLAKKPFINRNIWFSCAVIY
jgi:hypothetical protein